MIVLKNEEDVKKYNEIKEKKKRGRKKKNEEVKEKPKIKRKRRKKSPPPPLSPIQPKVVYQPILKSELDEKVKYLNKRIYYSKDTDRKKIYEEHKERLLNRAVVNDV